LGSIEEAIYILFMEYQMQKSFSRRAQQGFTLIELVVVIVILGILAATALPRFLNAAQSARQASAQGVQGAINSAIAIVHAQYLITGGSPTTVQLDGGTNVALWGGYPDSTSGGIGAAINYSAVSGNTGYTPVFNTAASASTATFTPVGATTPANCIVTYTSATATAAAAAATAPAAVTSTLTGC